MTFRRPQSYGRGDAPQDVALPVACPSCKSPAIVAAAKVPSAIGYWRCTVCGDIWSPARTAAPVTHGWRA
ncbi:hypothetical protein LuPra_01595 [Luteitalea pratensis]|uniref:Uncharacterized protein n=1 Tax=Luteitalea pratensis TaxID=1855912 RepID=A0A143PIL9_LUTPR|nr:MJ0042-type zinc finger domain-containing protein [Luteitalea pratensis]AMY08395.1 hypothetical protein LuPra_01595 [Luteitalea pratensis]